MNAHPFIESVVLAICAEKKLYSVGFGIIEVF